MVRLITKESQESKTTQYNKNSSANATNNANNHSHSHSHSHNLSEGNSNSSSNKNSFNCSNIFPEQQAANSSGSNSFNNNVVSIPSPATATNSSVTNLSSGKFVKKSKNRNKNSKRNSNKSLSKENENSRVGASASATATAINERHIIGGRGIVMVVPQQQQPQQQQQLTNTQQTQYLQQHAMQIHTHPHAHQHQHQQHHHPHQQPQQQQQQLSPSDGGSNSSITASPPLLQHTTTPPQGAQLVPPICAVHNPQQQSITIVATMHQAAAAHLAGGMLGHPPPHMHAAAHSHHCPLPGGSTGSQPPPQQLTAPPPQQHQAQQSSQQTSQVSQQQSQQQSSQHSQQQQQQHTLENGHCINTGGVHIVLPGGVSPSGSTTSSVSSGSLASNGGSSTGGSNNGVSNNLVTTAPPPPPPGPVYIQYQSEFYPAEFFVAAPHIHEGICPQHPHHHHQTFSSIPSEYGPTPVQMVSQNRPPPMPVPVQVPQGQVMQPYVTENGTVTHVVLSPQQYQLHTGQGPIHTPFIAANGTPHFFAPLPAGYPPGPGNAGPTHYHGMPAAHIAAANANASGTAPSPAQQQQVPPNGASQQNTSQQNISHSPSPPNNSYHKDERSQRQHNKLLRKLEKQRELNSNLSTPPHSPSPRRNELNGHNPNHTNSNQNHQQQHQQQFHSHQQPSHNHHNQMANNHPRRSSHRNGNSANHHTNQQHQHQQQQQHQGRSACPSSVGSSEDGEDNSSVVAEEEEDYQSVIIEQLSSIHKPEVIDVTSRSAKIIWEAPKLSEQTCINTRELRYNVLLSDRAKECKYKSLYKGESHDCIVQDLQPGQEYVVRLQVHYAKLEGDPSEPTEFTTPACEPEQPLPPKLTGRSKNSLQLRWNSPATNGSPILHYILEYDEGKSSVAARGPQNSSNGQQQMHFVEVAKTKSKHFILNKLQHSTVYNFRLAAVNEVGPSRYSIITPYSTAGNPPSAPKPPTLQTFTSSSLRLFWERRSQDADFVLQMFDRESGCGYLNVYNGPENTYECTKLRRATPYQFRLRAENEAGFSAWSSEITYKTAPEKPGRPGKPFVKGKIHGTFFKARWEKPNDTGGAEILRYFLEITSGPNFECVYVGAEPETTCDRLTPGTTYQLRASCEGPAGVSAYSEVAHITSEAVVPVAPPPPYYNEPPAPYVAVIRFDKPEYNGGAPILDYEVQLRPAAESPASQNEQPSSVYRGKDSYCVVDHLQPGHSYEVQVRAINRIGAGPWSSWFRFSTAAAPPQIPPPPKVTVKSATHIVIAWQAPDGNGAPITEYRLESATVAINTIDTNAAEADQKLPASSTFQLCYQGLQTNADLRNLMPYTVYYFRLSACNIAGVSNFSPIVQAKTPAAVPAAPQIKDYEFTANEVSLRWTEPECNGSPITCYSIECGDKTIATPDAKTEYTIKDLLPETTYKFRVQAVNGVGAGHFSGFEKLTTLPSPPAPPTLECTGVGHNFIKLKWGDGKNLDFTKYYVEMYVQRAKQYQEVYSGTNCMCKVNKLQERTAYTFRICAGNDKAGIGEYSDEYVFSTNATLPSNIKAPRVACEVACLLGHLSPSANLPPSGKLCETPSSFIPGLIFCLPVTLEWQHSKNSFHDRVEYELQYATGKENDFKKIYRGQETKFTIENLEPGNSYQFRVCPIRVTSTGEDLPGQFTGAFRYQVPALPSLHEIDPNLLSSAAAASVFGGAANAGSSSNHSKSNSACHGHSHHAHHTHHSHNHSHNHHSQHNSRHNAASNSSSSSSTASTNSSSMLHQRSVSASAVSSSSGNNPNSNSKNNPNPMIFGQNAISLIPIGSAMANELANLASCSDPHHHHHHHHHHHQFHGGNANDESLNSASPAAATLLAAASAGGLLAGNPILKAAAAAAAHHHQLQHNQQQNPGAIRRFLTKISSVYTNRKRFSDSQKAVIFLVSFFIFTFLVATLVKRFMR